MQKEVTNSSLIVQSKVSHSSGGEWPLVADEGVTEGLVCLGVGLWNNKDEEAVPTPVEVSEVAVDNCGIMGSSQSKGSQVKRSEVNWDDTQPGT